MNDGLIYKLVWMLNDETSTYKQKILQEAIDALQTEWHDAKTDPPEVNGEYLCFLRWPDGDGDFEVAFYVGEWTIERSDPVPVVLYWTEIPFLLEEDDASGKEVHLDGGDE